MRFAIPLAVLALAALTAPPVRGASPPTIGVILPEGDAEAVAALAGFTEALRLSKGPIPEIVERAIAPGETASGAAVAELRGGGAVLIVAFTGAATARVRDSVRDIPVVFAAADSAGAEELREGGGSCVTAGISARTLMIDLRRAVPGLRQAGVYVPHGDEAARISAAELSSESGAVVADAVGATPAARAVDAVAKLLPASSAVWVPPSVPATDVAALAAAMERRGVPLIGSRASHLAAGCAVVVRSDPRDLGAAAAVMASEILAGADPGELAVRRTRRRLVDVNLAAAGKLGFQVPLALLAWADSVVRPWPVKR